MVWAVSLSTTKLSPRRLTHRLAFLAFAVCLGVVTSTWPLAHTVLYLQERCSMAAPQCISGRTSYFRVRLEFLPIHSSSPRFSTLVGASLHGTATPVSS